MSRRGRFLSGWVTFLVVPSARGRVRRFALPVWALSAAAVAAVALAGAGAAGWRRSGDLARLERENFQLSQRVARYEAAVAEHRIALDRVAQLEERLRGLLSVRVPRRPVPVSDDPRLGRGGPTASAQNSLDFYLAMKRESAQTQLERDLLQLEVDSRLRQDGFREIVRAISRQRSLLRSTPSMWPARGKLSSPFGPRESPIHGHRSFHAGVDIAGKPGEKIRATADGVVVFAGWGQEMGGYGKVVVIDHGFGFQTRYAHNQDLLSNVGLKVRRGQVVAYMGSTGESTGPHCHYEVRLHGRPLNPLRFSAPPPPDETAYLGD